MEHTPGPWIACSGNAGEKFNIESKRYGNDSLPVATLRGPDRKANAQLIAAAPMLAAVLMDADKLFNAITQPGYSEETRLEIFQAWHESSRHALAAAGVLS